MERTKWMQETRMRRFEEALGWTEKRLTQEEAAQLLGVCPRTFRRYVNRYHEDGRGSSVTMTQSCTGVGDGLT